MVIGGKIRAVMLYLDQTKMQSHGLSAAEVMNVGLVRDEQVVERIREMFGTRGRDMADTNLRQADRPYALTNWDGLWGLLACITARKCGRQLEHFRAARRDVRRRTHQPRGVRGSSAVCCQTLGE